MRRRRRWSPPRHLLFLFSPSGGAVLHHEHEHACRRGTVDPRSRESRLESSSPATEIRRGMGWGSSDGGEGLQERGSCEMGRAGERRPLEEAEAAHVQHVRPYRAAAAAAPLLPYSACGRGYPSPLQIGNLGGGKERWRPLGDGSTASWAETGHGGGRRRGGKSSAATTRKSRRAAGCRAQRRGPPDQSSSGRLALPSPAKSPCPSAPTSSFPPVIPPPAPPCARRHSSRSAHNHGSRRNHPTASRFNRELRQPCSPLPATSAQQGEAMAATSEKARGRRWR